MGASALMSIGMRAMTANYAALQATSHNISNVNTAGYSRQSVVLETAGGQFSGDGFFGKGVDVATVQRAHDQFLTREAATTRSVAAADEARSNQLQQLEKVFSLGEDGLGYAAQELYNAFVDIVNKPQDASARQVALARADELAARFRSAAERLDALQAGVSSDMKGAVASVNMLSSRIAELNQKIALAKGSGHAPNDLLDQRDQAVNELSQYIQVTTIAADDGSLSVFIGGGQKLVLGAQATTLASLNDPFDASKQQLGIADAGGTVRAMPNELITGGSIAGLLRFQNEDLVDARNLVGQLASAIATTLNGQQALGLDLGTPASAGAPILSVGTPLALASTNNAMSGGVPVASYLNASGVRVSSVSVAVVDGRELQASDYELYADPTLPSGSYTLTRLSDGTSQTVTNGDVVDGFRIDVAAPAPAARDRFLLQPVGNAGRNTQRVLDDPKGIAAAAPVMATFDVDNTGTASLASLTATSVNASAAELNATITFTNDSGAYDWELRDASGTLVRSGSATWTAGQPIRSDAWTPATPAMRYDWEMSLNGVPKSGDVLSIDKTAVPASDNGNAKMLLALRDAKIVGQSTSLSGSTIAGTTATDAYANMLSDVGVRVQGAKLSQEMSASIASDAADANSSRSGVNLDEEAARLIQYQQTYQAAAKMLQVAQQVFDTLLQAGGAG